MREHKIPDAQMVEAYRSVSIVHQEVYGTPMGGHSASIGLSDIFDVFAELAENDRVWKRADPRTRSDTLPRLMEMKKPSLKEDTDIRGKVFHMASVLLLQRAKGTASLVTAEALKKEAERFIAKHSVFLCWAAGQDLPIETHLSVFPVAEKLSSQCPVATTETIARIAESKDYVFAVSQLEKAQNAPWNPQDPTYLNVLIAPMVAAAEEIPAASGRKHGRFGRKNKTAQSPRTAEDFAAVVFGYIEAQMPQTEEAAA